MTAILTGLRAEHEELRPKIERIRLAAELIDAAAPDALTAALEETTAFLIDDLTPHARAEEEVLYRAYDQVADSPWATDFMRRDHAAIAAFTEELVRLKLGVVFANLDKAQAQELRRVLYGLYTLIRQHFENEEQTILPRIEGAITQDAADELMESMESAAARFRAS
jgi:hemerythrin-like domain-containing protein